MKEKIIEEARGAGVAWPLEVTFDQVETCRCLSIPRERRHWLGIDQYTVADVEGRWHLIRHEICHLLMGERLDPCWVHIALARDYGPEKTRQLHLSWLGMDLWVNRLRETTWPGSMEVEQKETWRDFERLLTMLPSRQIGELFAEQIDMVIALADARAADPEHRWDWRPISRCLFSRERDVMRRLEDIFRRQPDLPKDAVGAAGILEKFVRDCALAWGFSITPTLIPGPDEFVWHL